MIDRDVFVGLVSIAAGLFVAGGAVFRHESMLRATFPALLEGRIGTFPARCALVLTGVTFVGLGLFILQPDWFRRPLSALRNGRESEQLREDEFVGVGAGSARNAPAR